MKTISKNTISLALIITFLFMINSFAAVVIFSVFVLYKKEQHSYYGLLGIFFALFVSLINATKVPVNDLAMYIDYYRLAERMPLHQYVEILWGKDVLYLGYTWFVYQIVGNHDKVFVFLMSLTSYLFFLKALLIGCKSLRLNSSSVYLCLVFLFFYPFIFSTSAHILRQTIAFSIISYVMAKKIFEGKNLWYIGVVASLFHGSVAFFIPFLFLKFLYKPFSFKTAPSYIAAVAVLLSVKIIAALLGTMGLSGSVFDFAVRRASLGTTFEASLSLGQVAISALFCALMFFSIYIFKPFLKAEPSFNFFANMTSLLFLFIIVNSDQGELQVRFNIFFWQLIPLFVCFLSAAYKGVYSVAKILLSVMVFASWMAYNNFSSPWRYECGNMFFLYPAIAFFL